MKTRTIVCNVGLFCLGCLIGCVATWGYLRGEWSNGGVAGNGRYVGEADDNYQGIDVSHYQGKIDWAQVATDDKIQFVYIKATEGASYVDKCYVRNNREARKQGLKVGAYHYLKRGSSIQAQFANFRSTVKKEMQDLVPMVDVEERVGREDLAEFCRLVEAHYGKRPVIYSTNRMYNACCAPRFNDYILMIGRYGKKKPVIKGRGHYNIWQYSERGKINGIARPVDLDRLHPDFRVSKLYLHKGG